MLTNKAYIAAAVATIVLVMWIGVSEYLQSRRHRSLLACKEMDIHVTQGNLRIVRSASVDVVSVRGAKSYTIRPEKGACRVEAATLDGMWVTVVVPESIRLRHPVVAPGARVQITRE